MQFWSALVDFFFCLVQLNTWQKITVQYELKKELFCTMLIFENHETKGYAHK